jgi:hypothetical protein
MIPKLGLFHTNQVSPHQSDITTQRRALRGVTDLHQIRRVGHDLVDDGGGFPRRRGPYVMVRGFGRFRTICPCCTSPPITKQLLMHVGPLTIDVICGHQQVTTLELPRLEAGGDSGDSPPVQVACDHARRRRPRGREAEDGFARSQRGARRDRADTGTGVLRDRRDRSLGGPGHAAGTAKPCVSRPPAARTRGTVADLDRQAGPVGSAVLHQPRHAEPGRRGARARRASACDRSRSLPRRVAAADRPQRAAGVGGVRRPTDSTAGTCG